ncbi:Methyltransferase type 12 [Novosphingobium nitrogenifigens DSM 19370]|uniref:Methyltransferase type 12 n=1 Tax=Novosphingobium nitrogenifigens DSM 19370 TaxID=983920 RepID=F1Z3W0_9SPHN|nr:class I SAM-dependent methyltransferase [Novosphingobium nitrogenifigens]EGD60716.1 Methyltransferase type 12 [Novosphingobium nitrogenifigens DSM 19370]
MTLPALRERTCPCCGNRRMHPEVRASQPAEAMTLEALRPFWTGLRQGKPFFTYHRCLICRMLFCATYFDDAQLADLYSAMAPNMEAVAGDAIAATQRGYYAAARAYGVGTGDYLEIGPDVGHVVRSAVAEGSFGHLHLFEPNRAVHPQLALAAGKCPATIRADLHDLAAVPDGSIGLAVMIHVLDHLIDPLATLATVHRKLRGGGTLLVVTHNEASLLRRIMGNRWPPFCLQHPHLFNPGTMAGMMQRVGYRDCSVSRSVNHFPIDFLARQAFEAMGIHLRALPLPGRSIALRLGNILALARKPDHPAAAKTPASEARAV